MWKRQEGPSRGLLRDWEIAALFIASPVQKQPWQARMSAPDDRRSLA